MPLAPECLRGNQNGVAVISRQERTKK